MKRAIPEGVQRVDGVDRILLHVAAHAARVRDVEHGIADGIEAHALKAARQDSGRPLPRRNRLHLAAVALRHEHHEAGKVVGFRTQPVEHPRSKARTTRDDRSAVHERVRRIVIDLFGPHRTDDARLVDDAANVREELADHLSRSTERLEPVSRAHARELLSLELRDLLTLRQRFGHRSAAHLGELRLVVERLEMRRSAGLIQEDDALGLRRKVERVHDAVRLKVRRLRRRHQPRAEQRIQGDDAESCGAAAEKRPPAHLAYEYFVHGFQFLVISSCRFSMALVTVASAARRAALTCGGSGASPSAPKARADAASEENRFRLRS